MLYILFSNTYFKSIAWAVDSLGGVTQ